MSKFVSLLDVLYEEELLKRRTRVRHSNLVYIAKKKKYDDEAINGVH
jgi:hypothetical protein